METIKRKQVIPKRLTITAVETTPELSKAILDYSNKMRNLSKVFALEEKGGNTIKLVSVADTQTTQVRQFMHWIVNFMQTEMTLKSQAASDEFHQMD